MTIYIKQMQVLCQILSKVRFLISLIKHHPLKIYQERKYNYFVPQYQTEVLAANKYSACLQGNISDLHWIGYLVSFTACTHAMARNAKL
jgi:hypothetical protein